MLTIFVIGNPAVGKTTLANKIINQIPNVIHTSDLDSLEELFWINDRLSLIYEEKWSNDQILIERERILEKTKYWNDEVNERISQFLRHEFSISLLKTQKSDDGGHQILDPMIWDTILEQTIQNQKKIFLSNLRVF